MLWCLISLKQSFIAFRISCCSVLHKIDNSLLLSWRESVWNNKNFRIAVTVEPWFDFLLIVWNIPMSRDIRVVLHVVIAESLKMPNSCFAVYSTMSVCRARVHILRSLKSLSFDIYVCLSRSMHFYCILRLCWGSPQSFYKCIYTDWKCWLSNCG